MSEFKRASPARKTLNSCAVPKDLLCRSLRVMYWGLYSIMVFQGITPCRRSLLLKPCSAVKLSWGESGRLLWPTQQPSCLHHSLERLFPLAFLAGNSTSAFFRFHYSCPSQRIFK